MGKGIYMARFRHGVTVIRHADDEWKAFNFVWNFGRKYVGIVTFCEIDGSLNVLRRLL